MDSVPESPSTELPEDAPLVAVWRGALVESLHHGRLAICDVRGEVLDFIGDPESYAYLRSSAKPFQALPIVLSGAADALGLTGEELAAVCGSHGGEEPHLKAVRSVLKKAGLTEDVLQSGPHPPLYAPAAARLARSGEEPRPIHSNCSGKHAGMLALCVHQGWEPEGYRSPDHPVQRWILEILAEVCGPRRDEILLAGDNCGVPTFALPLKSLAAGFARLATGEELPDELAEAAHRIRDAMRAHPYMVGGTGRFDTDLMIATNLVAKSGAEAVFACGSPEGWGLVLKVSGGASRAIAPAVLAAVAEKGMRVPEEMKLQVVTDLHGEAVGKVAALMHP